MYGLFYFPSMYHVKTAQQPLKLRKTWKSKEKVRKMQRKHEDQAQRKTPPTPKLSTYPLYGHGYTIQISLQLHIIHERREKAPKNFSSREKEMGIRERKDKTEINNAKLADYKLYAIRINIDQDRGKKRSVCCSSILLESNRFFSKDSFRFQCIQQIHTNSQSFNITKSDSCEN